MHEKIVHNKTSPSVKVKIEVEPKRVVQTSPVKLADVANIFIIR